MTALVCVHQSERFLPSRNQSPGGWMNDYSKKNLYQHSQGHPLVLSLVCVSSMCLGLWRCHWGLDKLHGLIPDYISSRLITLFCWLSHMNWSTMKPVMLHLFHTPPDCGTAFPRQCFTEKLKLIFLRLLPPGILSSSFYFYLFKHLLYLCHLFLQHNVLCLSV